MDYKTLLIKDTIKESNNTLNIIVNTLVNDTLNKKKAEFIESLDVDSEIFPNPIEGGLFRFCGKCYKCKNKENKNSFACNKLYPLNHPEIQSPIKNIDANIKLFDNEYLLLCCYDRIKNDSYGSSCTHTIISSYGRILTWNEHNKISFTNIIRLEGDDGFSGRPPPINPEYSNINFPLTQEYLDIINVIDFDIRKYDGSHKFDIHLFNRIMDVYKKYHPMANEIFLIEHKNNKLLEKEKELKICEDNYAKKIKDLSKKEDELINKEIKLENDIKTHQEKIKNIFKRENDLQLKETINSCKNEIIQSAFALNDIITIVPSIVPWKEDENYGIIQKKINNVIEIMNKLS